MNKKHENLLDTLLQIPPDFVEAKRIISNEGLNQQDINDTAGKYVDECICECMKFGDEDWNLDYTCDSILPGVYSTSLYAVLAFLLKNGLDPNYKNIYNESFLFNIRFISNEFVAADSMKLLLEHGADINAVDPPQTVFKSIEFDLLYDAVEQYGRDRFESLAHLWLVCLAYGGKTETPERMIAFPAYGTRKLFDLTELKDHRRFYVGVGSDSANTDENGVSWSRPWSGEYIIQVFDKKTHCEVLRIW
ncbi:MAG: ankyrin repeat domain-containing protein [Oscillospiraceae bacterium]|nr:ankyrin repeat domain-containing protein [Oscillospiraceae bacterium]